MGSEGVKLGHEVALGVMRVYLVVVLGVLRGYLPMVLPMCLWLLQPQQATSTLGGLWANRTLSAGQAYGKGARGPKAVR